VSAHALILIYGPPDLDLLEDSHHTLLAVTYQGDSNLQIIAVNSIISVVSMQPLPKFTEEEADHWFVVEKSGIDDTELTGYVDPMDEVRREETRE
jgi:hypothetical protein